MTASGSMAGPGLKLKTLPAASAGERAGAFASLGVDIDAPLIQPLYNQEQYRNSGAFHLQAGVGWKLPRVDWRKAVRSTLPARKKVLYATRRAKVKRGDNPVVTQVGAHFVARPSLRLSETRARFPCHELISHAAHGSLVRSVRYRDVALEWEVARRSSNQNPVSACERDPAARRCVVIRKRAGRDGEAN